MTQLLRRWITIRRDKKCVVLAVQHGDRLNSIETHYRSMAISNTRFLCFALCCLSNLMPLIVSAQESTAGRDNAVVESLLRIPAANLKVFPQHRDAVARYLNSAVGTPEYLNVVTHLHLRDEAPRVAELLSIAPATTETTKAALWLLTNGGKSYVDSAIK
jgi:hypothetical protein